MVLYTCISNIVANIKKTMSFRTLIAQGYAACAGENSLLSRYVLGRRERQNLMRYVSNYYMCRIRFLFAPMLIPTLVLIEMTSGLLFKTQHNFSHMLAAFHQSVRISCISRREYFIDHRFNLSRIKKRPDVFFQTLRHGSFKSNIPRA